FFGNNVTNNFFAPSLNPAQLTGQPASLSTFSSDHFVSGNSPNFDVHYFVNGPSPKTGTLFINHNAFFKFETKITAEEQSQFIKDFSEKVHDTWSNKHLLSLKVPGFSNYQCNVDVSISAVDKPADAHTVIDVKNELKRANVKGTTPVAGSETTHEAKMAKKDAADEPIHNVDQFDHARQVGSFNIGKTELKDCPDCEQGISEVVKIIKGIKPMDDPEQRNLSITYVGRASSDGDIKLNKELGQKRAKAVADKVEQEASPFGLAFITTKGEEHATTEAKFRRVDVLIDDKHTTESSMESQSTAAHEFGHMINFGDEYVEETKDKELNNSIRFRGEKPRHYDDVAKMVDKAAADELYIGDNSSIMSVGGDIKRGHYAYFVDALNKITAHQLPANTGGNNWKVE
ncbi:MAG: hypothetical protein ACQUYJ_13355, partial [Ferruginibacter sp.]